MPDRWRNDPVVGGGTATVKLSRQPRWKADPVVDSVGDAGAPTSIESFPSAPGEGVRNLTPNYVPPVEPEPGAVGQFGRAFGQEAGPHIRGLGEALSFSAAPGLSQPIQEYGERLTDTPPATGIGGLAGHIVGGLGRIIAESAALTPLGAAAAEYAAAGAESKRAGESDATAQLRGVGAFGSTYAGLKVAGPGGLAPKAIAQQAGLGGIFSVSDLAVNKAADVANGKPLVQAAEEFKQEALKAGLTGAAMQAGLHTFFAVVGKASSNRQPESGPIQKNQDMPQSQRDEAVAASSSGKSSKAEDQSALVQTARQGLADAKSEGKPKELRGESSLNPTPKGARDEISQVQRKEASQENPLTQDQPPARPASDNPETPPSAASAEPAAGPEASSLYHETSPQQAMRLLQGRDADSNLGHQRFLAKTPDLAIGQGANTGVVIEFDAAGVKGKPNESKPFGSDEVITEQSAADLKASIRSVTVKPGVIGAGAVGSAKFKATLAALERDLGFAKTVNPDGSVTYRREAQNKIPSSPPEDGTNKAFESPRAQDPQTEAGFREKSAGPSPDLTVPEMDEPSRRITSARKAMTTEDRSAMGMDELDSPSVRHWHQDLEDAKAKGIPERAMRIASEVNAEPRSLSSTETAGLVVKAVELKNEHAAVTKKVGSSEDPADIKTHAAEALRIEQEFDVLTSALRKSGTEKGRALASQKLTLDQDMSLISVKNRAKAAAGRELTAKEVSVLEKQVGEFQAKIKELEEASVRDRDQSAEAAIRRNRSAKRESDPAKRHERIKSLTGEARELLSAGCL